MLTRRSRFLVLATVVAACLTGCSPAPESPEPTPSFTSDAEAFAAAEETYRAYIDALNEVDLSDPETFEAVYAWTTGDLNASDRKGLSEYHASRADVTGSSVPVTVSGAAVGVDGTTTLNVCLDVSGIEVTNSAGESLVDPDRVDVQSLLVELTPSTDQPLSYLISSIDPRDGKPTCDS